MATDERETDRGDASTTGEAEAAGDAPESRELLDLLNRGFDGWGSREYFEWKYDTFPDYDPPRDNFLVRNDDGDPVAARRIFRRRLQTPDGTATVHVHGGTVVDEDYRGRGHYTTLLERSMTYSHEHADHVVTFNREGKITTQHHRDDGWAEVTLPVYSKVLSPSRVFAHYVVDADAASTLAGYASTVDRQVTRSEIASRLLALAGGAVYGDAVRRDDVPPTGSERTYGVEVIDGRELSDDLAVELSEHLQGTIDEPYHFVRRPETLRHAGHYPGANVYTARDSLGDLCAFAVAGVLEKDGLTECRIVEQSWAEPAATRELFERVETDARRAGADVLVTCSERRPAADWIPMGTEYVMWPPGFGENELPTSADAWRTTAYDVL